MPTILQAMGRPIPEGLDGESLIRSTSIRFTRW